MIYHMLPEQEWLAVDSAAGYRPASLQHEGFIHCSGDAEALLWAANQFYAGQPGRWLILGIDDRLLQAELRWESADGRLFPHLYGPLNLAAVAAVVQFPRDADGHFLVPELPAQARRP